MYTIKVDYNEPWEFIDWDMISDYSNDDEYYVLDEMYQTIEKYIGKGECETDVNKLIKEYNERFPFMLADTLEAMAQDIRNQQLIIKSNF